MCGIITIHGIDSKKFDQQMIKSMLNALSKRGPDDQDFVRIGNTVLGQTRLSIIDPKNGHQPMRDNANPYTIVFNGEIYDYKKLYDDLKAKGHIFSTNSDTEVILKAYAEYGHDCLHYLQGMFAFAIWDEKNEELFIARDRFGKKPFFYTWKGESFVAASEIKAFFASEIIKGHIDPQAIDDFLRLLYIPPNKSVYSNIEVLPPAHAGIVKNGKLTIWKYWKLEKKESTISYGDAKTEIKNLLDKSVKKRMIADVEIGSLLSGGIDSTLVTAYAQKYSRTPIKTFSIKYGNLINELPYAIQASKTIGTDHHYLNTSSNDLNELRNVIAYFDEPHADSSNFPQHLISKFASSMVKVALSGDGADELFMGYGWYQKYWHTPIYKCSKIFGNPFTTYKKTTEIFSESERQALQKNLIKIPDIFESTLLQGKGNYYDKINICDLLIYLPGQLLTKIDRTSMMNSLEMRTPFLDTALVEFVYNLPLEYKLKKDKSKTILKEILSEIMPVEFVNRKKQGFGAPLMSWIREKSIESELNKLVKEKNHPMYAYLNYNIVVDIIHNRQNLDKSSIQKIWSLLCLGIWFEINAKYHE